MNSRAGITGLHPKQGRLFGLLSTSPCTHRKLPFAVACDLYIIHPFFAFVKAFFKTFLIFTKKQFDLVLDFPVVFCYNESKEGKEGKK